MDLIRIYFNIDIGYYSEQVGYTKAIAIPNCKEAGLAFQHYKREKNWCGVQVNKIVIPEEEYRAKYPKIELMEVDEVLKRSKQERTNLKENNNELQTN